MNEALLKSITQRSGAKWVEPAATFVAGGVAFGNVFVYGYMGG